MNPGPFVAQAGEFGVAEAGRVLAVDEHAARRVEGLPLVSARDGRSSPPSR